MRTGSRQPCLREAHNVWIHDAAASTENRYNAGMEVEDIVVGVF